jgi:predicted RNase H-like HicB family nuclease
MEITVETHAEGEGYWSQIKELPGCFASAGTLSELREAVGEAVGLYLWDAPAELGDVELSVGATRVAVSEPVR